MRIQLSDHFTYPKLLRFVMPSIIMMIFTSIYGVVDGLFVSNFVGKTAFAAINLIMPLLQGLGSIGFMIGTGGTALVAMTLGTGDKARANRYFSMLICATVVSGVILTVLGLIFLRPIAILMGATDNLIGTCMVYGRIILLFIPAFMLQCVFQSFFVAAEKPGLGLAMTVVAGITNMVLDLVFVGFLGFGVTGAAVATILSQIVGGVIPLFYFARPNSSLLRLTTPTLDWRALGKVCVNGSSELMTNLSASLVGMLYNLQLLRLAGEDGVAAYGVIMYATFIFIAIYFGYSIGSAPIISYNYGARNMQEQQNLFRKSLLLITGCGLLLGVFGQLFAAPLARLFVGYDAALYAMTCHGFRLYALSFLICGFNIFGSSFFTALNNGPVSAAISFLRTLVFQIAMIFLLPALFGLDGVWLALLGAEILALAVTAFFTLYKNRQYHYIR